MFRQSKRIKSTCLIHPESETLMNEPGGAFSESQDFRASCALPFMMKWGGNISPAAFPQARTVTCSRLPAFDCMFQF